MNACFLTQQTEEQRKLGIADVTVIPDLPHYMRYQAHADRSYAKASAELLKRRQQRLKEENGFVLQKRAEAEHQSKENRENHHAEKHLYHRDR